MKCSNGKGIDGKVFPAGEVMQRADGVQYQSTAEAEAVNGAALVPVECLTPGKEGNAAAGTALTLVQPVAPYRTKRWCNGCKII